MRHIHSTSSRPAIAALSVMLTALALAACGGGSSSSSTKTTNAAATSTGASSTTSTTGTGTSSSTPTTGTGAPGTPGSGAGAPGTPGGPGSRFSALRECLAKDGIKLPQRKPGQRPGAGGFLGAGASGLPAGVTRAQLEAALRKCGGFARGRFPGAGNRFNSPVLKAAYTKFAACMRENGVNLPAPNTTGKGPVFSDKGLKLSSPGFKAAERKCRSDLSSGFRARPGAAGATPGTTG
jgi:hypothetical protein